MPTCATYSLRNLKDVCGGDHICFLCAGPEERWRVLGEFYKKGLEKNEQLMFFQNHLSNEEILKGLSHSIPSIHEIYAGNQFQIIPYRDVYLTAGKFDAEALIQRLAVKVNDSLSSGYTALRACGDMSWVHNEDNLTKKLIHYEANLNYDWPPKYSAICMYDISAFKPTDMLQILSTHPQAVINEKLLHNIYYMPPNEFLGPNLSKSMLNRWMRNIEERRIIEEKLIESKMDAEKAATAKSSFLATMSHEIRNPVNGIIGSVDMLSQTKITSEQTEYINIIGSASKHLYKVVNDVLDFSQIEHNKLHLSYEPLQLTDLLQDSIRLCQYSIQKNLSVSLRYHSHASCPPVIISDVTKLRQILVNLVGNSCKFTEEGEVVVYVTPIDDPDLEIPKAVRKDLKQKTKRDNARKGNENGTETENGNRNKNRNNRKMVLEFSVSDTGSGIDPNNQELLFKTFTRLDIMRKWAGTGLGLAICRQLVEAMGGTIRVESELGKGSTFLFRVPVSLPNDLSSPVDLSDSVCLSPTISPSPFPSLFPPSLSSFPSSLSSFPSSPSSFPSTPDSTTSSNTTTSNSTRRLLVNRPTPIKTCNDVSPHFGNSQPTSPTDDDSTNFPFGEHDPVPLSPSSSFSPANFGNDQPTLSLNSPPSGVSTPNFSGSHILVVEDDIMNQKILKRMLQKLKFEVTIANNGVEAVDLATNNKYTMIITDQYMPVMDGMTAVLKMREIMNNLCPPIVACTGTVEPRLHDVMDAVISKPVRFSTLMYLYLFYLFFFFYLTMYKRSSHTVLYANRYIALLYHMYYFFCKLYN